MEKFQMEADFFCVWLPLLTGPCSGQRYCGQAYFLAPVVAKVNCGHCLGGQVPQALPQPGQLSSTPYDSSLHCSTVQCKVHCTALHCTSLHCLKLKYIALLCTAHCSTGQRLPALPRAVAARREIATYVVADFPKCAEGRGKITC